IRLSKTSTTVGTVGSFGPAPGSGRRRRRARIPADVPPTPGPALAVLIVALPCLLAVRKPEGPRSVALPVPVGPCFAQRAGGMPRTPRPSRAPEPEATRLALPAVRRPEAPAPIRHAVVVGALDLPPPVRVPGHEGAFTARRPVRRRALAPGYRPAGQRY